MVYAIDVLGIIGEPLGSAGCIDHLENDRIPGVDVTKVEELADRRGLIVQANDARGYSINDRGKHVIVCGISVAGKPNADVTSLSGHKAVRLRIYVARIIIRNGACEGSSGEGAHAQDGDRREKRCTQPSG